MHTVKHLLVLVTTKILLFPLHRRAWVGGCPFTPGDACIGHIQIMSKTSLSLADCGHF